MKRILILILMTVTFCSCTRSPSGELQMSTSDSYDIGISTQEATEQSALTSDNISETLGEIYQSIDDKYVPDTTAYPAATQQSVTQYMSFKGLWIAIYELAPENSRKEDYIRKIENMMKNISSFGLTDIFVQVRANCDAIYSSSVFPACYMFSQNGKLYFDALEIICEKAHKYGLKVHAWINPYRACANSDKLPINTPVGVTKDQLYRNGKAYYLNPCADNTYRVILEGIREIINNYNVDGVHIDDYFYPTQDESIDKAEFNAYKKSGGICNLSQFRRNKVSSLVSSIYSLVKSKSSNLLFTISPSSDIEKNYNSFYADVAMWSTEKGYCDIVIPQIYFGFNNSILPFKETFDRWKRLTENSSVRLCAGLAVYKSGKEDKYAGEKGKNEWIENSDIIKRQVEYLRENNAYGFCLFSYDYVFGNKNFTNTEVQNLKSVL